MGGGSDDGDEHGGGGGGGVDGHAGLLAHETEGNRGRQAPRKGSNTWHMWAGQMCYPSRPAQTRL